MIRGVTFDKQLMNSSDHAHEVNFYFGGDMGVTKGCEVNENVDGNLVVSAGYFVIKGRLVQVVGSEIVVVPSVPSGTLYSTLVFEIDLTQENTITEFNQGSFKIVSNASAYPTLTQEDLDNGGNVYQFEFARFENSISGIANLADTRVLVDLTKYAPKVSPAFTGNPTAPTPAADDSDTSIATTAFVITQIGRDAPKKATGGTVVNFIWSGTQAQYDAIGTKDENTLYFVV